jgi:CRP-like cAMP-binding protein
MAEDIFEQLPLFQDVHPAGMALVRTLFVPCHYSLGTVVFEQGNLADNLYIVVEGEVGVRFKPDDAPQINVAKVGSSGIVGWSAALGSSSYTSSAVCLCDCLLVRIRSEDLHDLCVNHPETGRIILDRLAAVISERLRNTHHQVFNLLEQGLRVRSHETVSPEWGYNRQEWKNPLRGGAVVEASVNGTYTEEEHLRVLIERVSAYIEQFHGGSVEFVSFDGEVLQVRMAGACEGCPLSPNTLHGWVEGTIRQFFPGVSVEEADFWTALPF